VTILSLKNSKEFDLVNKYGTKRYGAYLIAIFATNFTHIEATSENTTFFGMKVSKKLSKKAVVRNKIKRRIRHLMRNLVKDSSINTDNTALVIIPKKGFEDVNFQKLTDDLHNVLQKIIVDKLGSKAK
jgi:ribonuclease P protein component